MGQGPEPDQDRSNPQDPGSELASFQSLQRCCHLGAGEITRHFFQHPMITVQVEPLRSLIREELLEKPAIFVPHEHFPHPFLCEDQQPARGANHPRSFQWKSGEYRYVIVGDLNAEHAQELAEIHDMQNPDLLHIPAGCSRDECENMFDAAVLLHQTANALGTDLYTLLPISATQIEHIWVDGVTTIRDYLNSEHYMPTDPQERRGLEYTHAFAPGDFLFEEKGLIPGQFAYLIEGTTVRSVEAIELLSFEAGCPFNMKAKFGHNAIELVVRPHGDRMLDQGCIVRSLVYQLYHELFREYGLTRKLLDELFPQEIIEENYTKALRTLRQNLNRTKVQVESGTLESSGKKQSVAEFILYEYIERLTHMAALAHVAGYTYSDPDDPRAVSSLGPKNTTLGGRVLNLGGFSEHEQDDNTEIMRDFTDLLYSVAHMRRLLMDRPPRGLLKFIERQYFDQVRDLHARALQTNRPGVVTPTQPSRLINAIQKMDLRRVPPYDHYFSKKPTGLV